MQEQQLGLKGSEISLVCPKEMGQAWTTAVSSAKQELQAIFWGVRRTDRRSGQRCHSQRFGSCRVQADHRFGSIGAVYHGGQRKATGNARGRLYPSL